MKKSVLLVGLTWATTAAQASDWWMVGMPLGATPNRQAFFADKSTIRTEGLFRRAWLSDVNETPVSGVKSYRTYVQFDCKQSRYLTLQESRVLANGQTISPAAHDGWKFIAPDTPMRVIADNVCPNRFYDGITARGATPEAFADAIFQR